MFDGISGIVTQPIEGAKKEGVAGFIKGFGKGIGGIVLKPSAGETSVVYVDDLVDESQPSLGCPDILSKGCTKKYRNTWDLAYKTTL